ncbi:MAG: flavin reductase family protein [Methylocella sp.]
MSSSDALPLVSARDFRDAVGLFPTGVAIVTATSASGDRLGATVSSFSSVSLEPPLVSFNLSKAAKSFDEWASAACFAVNLLSENQDDLSTRFARSMTDKWGGITPLQGKMIEAPLLEGALAWLECSKFAQYEGGDHLIILGRILILTRNQRASERPLVFFKSRYHRLDADRARLQENAMWLHGW